MGYRNEKGPHKETLSSFGSGGRIAFAAAPLSYVGWVDSSLRSSPLRGACGVQTGFASLSPASECTVPTVLTRIRLK